MEARREYILAAVVGIALAALIVWLAPSGSRPPAPDTGTVPGVTPAPAPGTEKPPGAEPTVMPHVPAAGSQNEKPSVQAKPDTTSAVTEEEEWELQPEVDFTPADLAGAGKVVAHLNLGEYRVAAGAEFEVKLALAALPLESMTLIFEYDPTVLEVVQGSARPVGRAFRRGIEFHVGTGAQKGQIALIHQGTPGRKNLNAVTGAAVAAFRMKALATGETTLKVKEASFTNGLGDNERFDVTGGRVVVY